MIDPERLLIVCATDGEIPDVPFGRVAVCGVGKAAAAVATMSALAAEPASGVVSFGVAGALAAHLDVGDVVVGRTARVLDEGLETGDRFTSFADGPMPVPAGDAPLRADPRLLDVLLVPASLPFRLLDGDIGTVSVCAGSRRLADERAALACAEAMEGAAVALAAAAFDVPFVEVRGISNRCGPRDGAPFDLETSVRNATRVLARLGAR